MLKKHAYHEINIEYKDFLLPNTPPFLINHTIALGFVLEKIPIMNYLSQSIFISAKKWNIYREDLFFSFVLVW